MKISHSSSPALPSASELASFLESIARMGIKYSYSDLLIHYGFSACTEVGDWRRSGFQELFNQIDHNDILHKRPLKTSAILKQPFPKVLPAVPGNGYFKKLAKYRDIPIPETAEEKRLAHGTEIKKLIVTSTSYLVSDPNA